MTILIDGAIYKQTLIKDLSELERKIKGADPLA
jgi:hypothetical protein